MNIGFIGIGVMGISIARNLMRAGHSVTCYSRTKEKALPLISEGAVWYDTAADCARGQDAVITIVGFPKDVEEVYFGESGIFSAARAGTYLIDMTTTEPSLSVRIYNEAKVHGCFALDAPVSGGDSGARQGTLSIMVGGDRAPFDACLPLFEAMGKTVLYEGGAGAGQHTKMANQIAIAGAIAGVCEAIAYARRAGLDEAQMLATIEKGAAASWQLSNNGRKILAGDELPGFYIMHFIKDMSIAAREAKSAGLRLPVLEQVLAEYKQLSEEGFGRLGTQALIRRYL